MGLHRTTQLGLTAVLDGIELRDLLAEHATFINRAADPFHIDDPCTNPEGHRAIASCSDIVCCHCSKVFWS